MALTPGMDHESITFVFSDSTIREQARIGNITQDDADLAISLRVDSDSVTTEDVVNIVNDVTARVDAQIAVGIGDAVGGIGDVIGGIEDTVKGWITAALDPILNAINGITDKIVDGLSSAFGFITNTIDNLASGISAGIGGILTQVNSIIDTIEEKVLDPILGVLGVALDEIKKIDDRVLDIVDAAVSPIVATTNTILDSVTGFATALRDTIPDLAGVLGSAIGSVGDTIGDAVKGVFDTFIDATGLGGIKAVMSAIARIPELVDFQGAFSPPLTEKMGDTTLDEFRENPAAMITLIIPFVNSLAQIVFSGQVERVQQASRGDHNSGILPISDLSMLHQRGLLSKQDLDASAFRHGLDASQVFQVLDITRQRPGTMDIIDYWRRELISPEDSIRRLRDLGWSDENVDLIQSAAFPPPGVQDLIRMAVREVFTPEIAEQFGQFEGIPPKYLEWAKKIGLSEEWAINFWGAHWGLPSVQQGFEMLHRSVITGEDLERLLVALDVMPFWRQPLTEISFRPYTRVDVRRMFALGVIDRPGVKRAYLDLGFNEEKAENMAEFTVRWVESTRKVEKEKERDLTKADIVGLFNDGLLSEVTAKAHLETMGFSDDEAELLIAREVMQELRNDRKADIKLIVDQAKIKVLSFNDAQDRLNGLDLTRKEMERALIEVTRATTERIRLPSKNDLDSWRELQLLSPTEYVAELDNLGFPSKYIALYDAAFGLEEAEDLLAAEEREAKKAEPRPVTKGQLDSLLRSEIVNSGEYETGLETLGFGPSAIVRFIEQITVEIEERRIEDEARLARGDKAAEKERLLNRVTLGKLLLKEIIDFPAYREGLRQLGFSSDSIDLLERLIRKKIDIANKEE